MIINVWGYSLLDVQPILIMGLGDESFPRLDITRKKYIVLRLDYLWPTLNSYRYSLLPGSCP